MGISRVMYSDDCICQGSGQVLISGTTNRGIGVCKAFDLSQKMVCTKVCYLAVYPQS